MLAVDRDFIAGWDFKAPTTHQNEDGRTRRDTATATSRPVSNTTRNMNLFPRLNVRPRW